MKVQPYRRVRTEEKITKEIQDGIVDFTTQLLTSDITIGNLLSFSLDASITNEIEHKLGQTPLGYIVVYQDANANIWVDATSVKFLGSILYLKSDINVNIKIWVF